MIELRDISVGFGEKRVLCGLKAIWPDSGTILLRGASGSGKTTLLRVLAGLLAPDMGMVSGLTGRRIGMVFQEDRLLPWRTTLENVSLTSDRTTAKKLLERLDLGDALNLRPVVLSGGMRRRVALARALSYSDDVLLLDEPFNGLDAEHRAQAASLLQRCSRLRIVATHNAEDADLLNAVETLHL